MRQATQLFLDLFRVRRPQFHRLRRDETLTAHSVEWLTNAGAAALAKKVSVVWNSRLTTTAGQARFQEHLVVLNPRLQPFGEAEVDRTLRHELAHLLANFRGGRRKITPHGPEWRQACYDLGLVDEKRCHDLPLPRRKVVRRLVYRCGSCGMIYQRVRPFRRKVACLACCRSHNRGVFHEKFALKKCA